MFFIDLHISLFHSGTLSLSRAVKNNITNAVRAMRAQNSHYNVKTW